MAGKRSPTNRDAEPPRIDDLKLINGIGPAVEKRLIGIGILTYAQLTALSPADIAAAVADLAGLSAERIIKQDWIGQARKLAEESATTEAQKAIEAPIEPPAPLEEHIPAATHPVEPQQVHELAPESISSEAQEKVEAPADSGQAATFKAPVEPPSSAPKDTAPSMAGYHPANFTVELLLDENNYVHSTYVMDVQGKREQTWLGWPNTELLDFLNQNAGVNVLPEEPKLAIVQEPEKASALVAETESKPLPTASMPELAGTLHVREMKILGAESTDPRRTLPRDQPFDVSLTLDLTEIAVPDNTLLNYKASIYGKSRGSRSGHAVGEAEGTIESADTVTINVEGTPLAEGTYRMAATVMVALPGTKLTVKPGTTAAIGDMLQVY
jgi:hypothetical protein